MINDDLNNITLWSALYIAVPELENEVSFITTKRVKVQQTLGLFMVAYTSFHHSLEPKRYLQSKYKLFLTVIASK